MDCCYQGWEADGSLHCQQREVTNNFYGLALLRMRVARLRRPVFQVSGFSFSAIGIPPSCATLGAHLFLEELKMNRNPPLKRKNSHFLGGLTAILPKFCLWLFGQCSGSKWSQNGDLKGLQYLLATKPDSCVWSLLWAKHEWSAWFLLCIHRPCTTCMLQSVLLGKHKYPLEIIHNLKYY